MRSLALAGLSLLALSACKPTAEDIELVLGSRGMAQPQAACIGQGLQSLTEDDWMTIGSFARDAMMSGDDFRNMTIGDVQARLSTLDDPRLVGTLVRTGLGCMVMHGDFGMQPRAQHKDRPYDGDDAWLDEGEAPL